MIYDVAILGGGPAGCAGAVYSARKKLKTVLITDSFGGQSVVSPTIYNWIGTPEIGGIELAKALESHVRAYPDDVSIVTGSVSNLEKSDNVFTVTTADGQQYQSRTVLYTLGSCRKQLDVPGANEFEHKGLTYCASCDGPLFADQDVAVIGGGNAGFESALQLLAYCKSVTLLHRSNQFRADEITVRAAEKMPNFKAVKNVTITKVTGEGFVNAIHYRDSSNIEVELSVAGIFVEIGQLPNTSFVKKLEEMSNTKLLSSNSTVIIDPTTNATELAGFWAAGDCTNVLYHQNNIAAGDAVRAIEDLYIWLRKNH